MKKVLISIALFLSIFTTPVTINAEEPKNQILIDGVAIAPDLQPNLKNDRVMVPLRVISEYLGATVDWSDKKILITKNEMVVTLNLNSNNVDKNGEAIKLDVNPYLHNNLTYVPLRFLAETFNFNVIYNNGVVIIDKTPFVINNKKISLFKVEYHMIIGGWVYKYSGAHNNKEIYNLFEENKGEIVEAPADYDWFSHAEAGSYYKNGQYDFLDETGKSVQQYDIYTLNGSHVDNSGDPFAHYPKVLLHDVSQGKWYLFSQTALDSINNVMKISAEQGLMQAKEI